MILDYCLLHHSLCFTFSRTLEKNWGVTHKHHVSGRRDSEREILLIVHVTACWMKVCQYQPDRFLCFSLYLSNKVFMAPNSLLHSTYFKPSVVCPLPARWPSIHHRVAHETHTSLHSNTSMNEKWNVFFKWFFKMTLKLLSAPTKHQKQTHSPRLCLDSAWWVTPVLLIVSVSSV